MNLSDPIRSVIPSLHGDVLAVLARTSRPLTGRGVAALVGDGASQKGVNLVLRALARAGLVLVEDYPPAKAYRLNRAHLAAEAVVELASLRDRLLDAMRQELAGWELRPDAAWLFGSGARSDGTESSDLDVLVVRPDRADRDEATWDVQLASFAELVEAWTGNHCETVEYRPDEFDALMSGDDRLARDLRTDAISLTSTRLPRRASRQRAHR